MPVVRQARRIHHHAPGRDRLTTREFINPGRQGIRRLRPQGKRAETEEPGKPLQQTAPGDVLPSHQQ